MDVVMLLFSLSVVQSLKLPFGFPLPDEDVPAASVGLAANGVEEVVRLEGSSGGCGPCVYGALYYIVKTFR